MIEHNARRRAVAFRSIWATVGVVGLAATLVGCGTEAPESAEGGTEAPESAEGTTISFWQYYGDTTMPQGVPLYDFIKRYEDSHEGVNVDVRYIPYDDFYRTVIQSAAAGDAPDITLVNSLDTTSLAQAGLIQDLSDRVDEWGEKDAYFPGIWETTQYDGATYGIPHLADAYGIYYNKTLLDDAGLTPPKTWDEMEKTAAELSVDGRHGLAASGIEGVEGSTPLIIRTLAEGAEPTELDSAAGATALDSFQGMVDSGALSEGFLTWIEDDVASQFGTGEAAMMLNSATYISILREQYPDLDWSVSLLPEGSESRTTWLAAENLTISASSEYGDEAWDLITFMQDPDELAVYLPARNKLPARNDVPDETGDPVRATFSEQLEDSWAPTGDMAPVANEVFTLVQSALQQKLSGGDTDKVLKDVQAKIDEAISG
jgi:multiple sugar transport system substrate-binding protein